MLEPGRIVVLGCGSVAQCVVPVLLRDHVVSPGRLTIIDMVDNRHRLAAEIAAGVTYIDATITPSTLAEVLRQHLQAGDMCLDLAWNIDNCEILDWCRSNGVRYLNTSIEVWDPYEGAGYQHPLERTLYTRHMEMRRMIAAWGDNRGPTAVVEHGANPGLVSHLTKRALTDIAATALRDGIAGFDRAVVESALADERFNLLAQALGVRVVHVSERDTQVASIPKQTNEFVNTWSIDGLLEEGIAPAELGWGTHERCMPPDSYRHSAEGPRHQICLARPGASTWVRSWVPSGEIIGMVVRHGEAFTICDHLTVWSGGTPVYRPTVHYAYCPSSDAIASMHELKMQHWEMHPNKRIMNDEIVSGRDELGVLLMGHPFRSWWTGSLLSIDEARRLVPHQNATTLQVAASIVACVRWMIDNPHEGVRVPDDLPWRRILADTAPYLGEVWSGPVDWDPLRQRVNPFAGFDSERVDLSDPWQFTNFLVDSP